MVLVPLEVAPDTAVAIDIYGQVQSTTRVDLIARIARKSEISQKVKAKLSDLEIETTASISQMKADVTIQYRGDQAPFWYLYRDIPRWLMAAWMISMLLTIFLEGALRMYSPYI